MQRRGALTIAGLLLFVGGLVTGYSIRGAELAPDHAGDVTARAIGSAPPVASAPTPAGDGGAEASTRASTGRAQPAPDDLPARPGGGAPPETIGAERDRSRASSATGATGSASSEQAGLHDGGAAPRGRLDASAIRDVVRDHRDQLGFCFAWQLHSNPELRGRVTMSFTIGEDGRVTRAEVLDDQLGDATVLRCFQSVTNRMRFPPPEGGEVSVHYPFELSPETAEAE